MAISAEDVAGMIDEVTGTRPTDSDADLWETGVMDSYAIVELVALLEERLGTDLSPDLLRKENFASVAAVVAMANDLVAAR